jgi:hypothetical protein
MYASLMAAAVGVKNLPYPTAKISLKDEHMMCADSGHTWSWRRSGKPEPIGSKP